MPDTSKWWLLDPLRASYPRGRAFSHAQRDEIDAATRQIEADKARDAAIRARAKAQLDAAGPLLDLDELAARLATRSRDDG